MKGVASNELLSESHIPSKLDEKVNEWLKIAEFKLSLDLEINKYGERWPTFFSNKYYNKQFEFYNLLRFERSLKCLSELFRWLMAEMQTLVSTTSENKIIQKGETNKTPQTNEVDKCCAMIEQILNFVIVLTDTLKSMEEVKSNPTSQRMLTYAYGSLPDSVDCKPTHSPLANVNGAKFKKMLNRASQINKDSLKIQNSINEKHQFETTMLGSIAPVDKPMHIEYASTLGIFVKKNSASKLVEIDCVIFAEFISNFKQSLEALEPLQMTADLDVKF